MLQQTARAAPAAGRGTYRTTRWFLRAGFGVMAGLAVAQPVLAGSYLSGNLDAISVHSAIGGTLPVVGFLALILAVLHWWPGRGPAWPALVMVVLTVLIVVQANAGYSRTLGLHVPLARRQPLDRSEHARDHQRLAAVLDRKRHHRGPGRGGGGQPLRP
ncbi:MAG: hypothetical protein H0V10_02650, partial [Geodermatophilaceae bacterium]|nr:hypothetical protein [Geodermatophilaceae bacterium]